MIFHQSKAFLIDFEPIFFCSYRCSKKRLRERDQQPPIQNCLARELFINCAEIRQSFQPSWRYRTRTKCNYIHYQDKKVFQAWKKYQNNSSKSLFVSDNLIQFRRFTNVKKVAATYLLTFWADCDNLIRWNKTENDKHYSASGFVHIRKRTSALKFMICRVWKCVLWFYGHK